jgi:hypothetical protein
MAVARRTGAAQLLLGTKQCTCQRLGILGTDPDFWPNADTRYPARPCDLANPEESLQRYYRVLTLACVPVLFGLLGCAGMVVLALFPPLWCAVMDPRIRAYYAGQEHQLSSSQLAP